MFILLFVKKNSVKFRLAVRFALNVLRKQRRKPTLTL